MPLEYPEQSYFPSCKVRLTIRLDEFGDAKAIADPPPKTTKNLEGTHDPRAPLTYEKDNSTPGVTRYNLVEKGKKSTQAATSQASSSDALTFYCTIIPKDLDWNQNGIRTADTLAASFKFIDLPIDPRTVRSCAVEAFIGSVTSSEYQLGIEGRKRNAPGSPSNGESLLLVPDTYLDVANKQRTNSRFHGWVDKWEVEWKSEDEPLVHIECRDNTALFINEDAPPRLGLDPHRGIDEAIALYLSHFPQFQGIAIEYRPLGDKVPTLRDVLLDTAYTILGVTPARGGGAAGKTSVWDHLVDVCLNLLGHAVYLDGTSIIIQKPRALVSNKGPVQRPDDPFQGRKLATGVEFPYRRFIYGRNLSSMHIQHQYARQSVVNVEARSYNFETKTNLVERYPQSVKDNTGKETGRQVSAIPGQAQPEQKWTIVWFEAIKDRKTLRALAQAVYEQIGRSELLVDMKTRNLSSFGGGNLDPDILDMKAGDVFELLTHREDEERNTLNTIEQVLSNQQKGARFMQGLGFPADFAAAYAKAFNDANFLTQFRMKSMKCHWSTETGLDFAIVGMNYIEVRADKVLPQGEEPGTYVPGTIPPNNKPVPIP